MLISSRFSNKHGRHRQFFSLIGWSLKNILLWNRLAKWTKAWLKASMEGFLCRLLILSRSVYKHGPPQTIIVSGWSISKNMFSSDAAYPNEASMEGPLYRLLILSRSVNKLGRIRQFFFLVGRFLKKYFPLKPLGQMNQQIIGSIYEWSSIQTANFVPIR
jgi:hypothetical protein